MSDLDLATLRAPALDTSKRQSWRTGLTGTPVNALVTVATLAFLVWLALPVFRWALIDATWSGTAKDCALAGGACWAFLGAKLRFILFALYPPDLQWRAALALVLILGLLGISTWPRFWRRELLVLWPIVLLGAAALLAGVVTPPRVETNRWGGLPLTLFVWMVCFSASLPIAVLLALARRSRMGGLRLLSIAYIELFRAVPMVAILYFATLILPMAAPSGQSFDKILRAMIMVTLFWAAYGAEVVRGGLQVVSAGQYEAAAALGLGYWRIMRLVILPQALRIVIPGLVNLAVGFLLATSLLAVIGILDLLNAARTAALDPDWLGFYDEAYLAVAAIYFAIGYGGSRYSLWLERHLGSGGRSEPGRTGSAGS